MVYAEKSYLENQRLQTWFTQIEPSKGSWEEPIYNEPYPVPDSVKSYSYDYSDFYKAGSGPVIRLVEGLPGLAHTEREEVTVNRQVLKIAADWTMGMGYSKNAWQEFFMRVIFHEAVHWLKLQIAWEKSICVETLMYEVDWNEKDREPGGNIQRIKKSSDPAVQELETLFEQLGYHAREEGRVMENFVWGEQHIPDLNIKSRWTTVHLEDEGPQVITKPLPPQYLNPITSETRTAYSY